MYLYNIQYKCWKHRYTWVQYMYINALDDCYFLVEVFGTDCKTEVILVYGFSLFIVCVVLGMSVSLLFPFSIWWYRVNFVLSSFVAFDIVFAHLNLSHCIILLNVCKEWQCSAINTGRCMVSKSKGLVICYFFLHYQTLLPSYQL